MLSGAYKGSQLFRLRSHLQEPAAGEADPAADPRVRQISSRPHNPSRAALEAEPRMANTKSWKSVKDPDMEILFDEFLGGFPISKVLSVLPNQHLERDKFPLILGVRGGKQGLSCGKAGEPKLQLEDVNLPDLSNNAEEAKRFTFFKDFNGSTHTFESAAYPKWFLCSAVEAHKPLAVTDSPGGTDITTFFFQRK